MSTKRKKLIMIGLGVSEGESGSMQPFMVLLCVHTQERVPNGAHIRKLEGLGNI